MARIYDFEAFRQAQDSRNNPKPTPNQEILAQLNAIWAARTPEEILQSKILGTEEELDSILRRYQGLLEESEASKRLADNRTYDPRQHQSKELDNGLEP